MCSSGRGRAELAASVTRGKRGGARREGARAPVGQCVPVGTWAHPSRYTCFYL